MYEIKTEVMCTWPDNDVTIKQSTTVGDTQYIHLDVAEIDSLIEDLIKAKQEAAAWNFSYNEAGRRQA